jgi:5-methylcytosine-specific restriction endonuclease McrA
MSNREARHKRFDRFARELESLVPVAAGRCCCPLCLELFGRSEVDELLTLEHIIPDGLGKRLLALTCKRCNNDVGGANLDSHLQKEGGD